MKMYGGKQFPHGVLHISEFGMGIFTHTQQETDKLPRLPDLDDTRFKSFEPADSNVDVVVKTSKHRSLRLNIQTLATRSKIHDEWVEIVEGMKSGERVVSAAIHGPLYGCAPRVLGTHESIMYVDNSMNYGIKILRTRHRVPPLNVELLSADIQVQFPARALSESGIIVLHRDMMRAAMIADGVTPEEIAARTHVIKQIVVTVLSCNFSAKEPGTMPVLDWIVQHNYTFNHLCQRPDAKHLLNSEAEPRLKGITKIDRERSQIRTRLLAGLAVSGLTIAEFANKIDVSRKAIDRAVSKKQWKHLSMEYWTRIERSLENQVGAAQNPEKALGGV